ncbi:MAG: alpha-ribazole phosphatase family protein [Coriobacteriia bacterium]|nr:alpha-ribazole phosphatase family protein [Coriobacteriia bacterium]
MKLYVIRHPQPIGAEGICYGQTDLDISDEALAEGSASLSGLLESKPIDMVYSSPLIRCHKLAFALSNDLCLALQTEPLLVEMDFGIWEGLLWDEIDRQAFDEWMADYVNNAPPAGENFQTVLDRVNSLIGELKERGQEEVALVTHAGVIRALLAVVLNIPVDSCWRFSVNYNSLLTFRIGEEAYQNRLLSLI